MKPFILLISFSLFLGAGCTSVLPPREEAVSKNTQAVEIQARPLSPATARKVEAAPVVVATPVAVAAPVVVAAPVAVAAPAPAAWSLQPGLLRAQLESWAAMAGYQVVWDVTRDYSIQNSTAFQGSFVDALTQLFTGLQQMGNSFKVTVYQGNKVVLISEE